MSIREDEKRDGRGEVAEVYKLICPFSMIVSAAHY